MLEKVRNRRKNEQTYIEEKTPGKRELRIIDNVDFFEGVINKIVVFSAIKSRFTGTFHGRLTPSTGGVLFILIRGIHLDDDD